MQHFDAAIIGGGASGIVAAISCKRAGGDCILLEKGRSLGKKILASGNGRCNLSNDDLGESFYNPASRPLVKSIFAKFGKQDIVNFFNSLGLFLHSENGRIFPATNQSQSVLKSLEIELTRLSIPVELNFDAVSLAENEKGFLISSRSGAKISSQNVVLAGGGKSYPAFGSDGSAYSLAKKFGHNIVEPVPTAVGLVAKDPAIHFLQGQRILVVARSVINGKVTRGSKGELLFTKYGLSGTAILDVSEDISVAINRGKAKAVEVSVDSVPFMEESELDKELSRRRAGGCSDDDMLIGILPNKFCRVLKSPSGRALKDWRFRVTATRGWNEAEFTAGGINITEVKEKSLESKLKNRLYFAGEILDVNGTRGGYNLAWAWSSGYVAGLLG